MTDKEDKKRNLRKIRGISINWEFNKPTGKEHLLLIIAIVACIFPREGANKRGNSSRLTQSFHFFMFEPIFSPVNALNQPI